MNNNKNIVEEMRDNAENIADRIEREFIPRPKFKGGEYVHLDDEFKFHDDIHTVDCIASNGYDEWYVFAENGEMFDPCICEYYVEPDTIKKVWEDAETFEKLLKFTSRIDDGDIASLLQRLEKIIREEYKSKEKR